MNEGERCCEFGGDFAVKFGNISAHIAERKCENITVGGADAVVFGDLGCMLNIDGRLFLRGDALPVFHFVSCGLRLLNMWPPYVIYVCEGKSGHAG